MSAATAPVEPLPLPDDPTGEQLANYAMHLGNNALMVFHAYRDGMDLTEHQGRALDALGAVIERTIDAVAQLAELVDPQNDELDGWWNHLTEDEANGLLRCVRVAILGTDPIITTPIINALPTHLYRLALAVR
jgi:hypothetical protein